MKKLIPNSCLMLAALLSFITVCNAAGFELIKKEKDICLYERWVTYNGNTVRELKADFIVKAASAKAVIALLKDPRKGIKWNKHTRSFKIAVTQNEDIWYTYIRYKMPWPMNDQDCSLKYFFNKNDMSSTICPIYFEDASAGQFPLIRNVNRITGTKGKWVLEKVKNGHLRVTYQIMTDKSASVPRWIADPLIHDNLLTTMAAFRELLEQVS
ncbi:MAG: START domain-containing protein [Niabella sp.]